MLTHFCLLLIDEAGSSGKPSDLYQEVPGFESDGTPII
jgi:hypothetical protein